MKKIVSLLAVLVLVLSCSVLGIGTVASADEESSADDFLVFDGVLEEYVGAGGDVVIPASLGVKEIAANAFYENSDITSVVIPEGVEVIGYWSFRGCENIESITLPYSLCELAEHCFSSAAITEITIPGNVEVVGYGAFSSCQYLENITISYGVKEIMVLAFGGTGWKNIVFPETVELICGGSLSNNKNPNVGKSEVIICNPDCEIGGWTKDNSKDAYKHAWHGYVTPFSSNASATQYVIYVPKDSEVSKTLKENMQKWLDADAQAGGSSIGGGKDKFDIREKEKEYFEELPENQEGYGTPKPVVNGNGSDDNKKPTDNGNQDTNQNVNNSVDNNSSGSNSGNGTGNGTTGGNQTIIEQGGDNTTLIIVVCVIGGIMLLAIIAVVILAATGVLFGKKKSTPKADDDIEVLKAKLEAAELRAKLEALENKTQTEEVQSEEPTDAE